MTNKRLPDEVFENLRRYEKEYGVVWVRPTQNDKITHLLRRVARLCGVQRAFNPLKSETLMEYHRAVRAAEKALKALGQVKRKKRSGSKPGKTAEVKAADVSEA